MWLDKRKAFGNIFLARIPILVVTLGDEEAIRWLWMNDRKHYTEVTWPPSFSKLLGPGSLSNTTGVHHKTLRRIMEPFFAPNFTRNYVAVFDQTTQQELEKWCCQPDFLASNVFKLYSLRMFLVASFGAADEDALNELSNDFQTWLAGFMSLSLDMRIPGMAFDAAMKARDRILNRVDAMIDEFAQKHPVESEKAQNTIIGRMIYATDEMGNTLTRQERQDNTLLLLFAGKYLLWWRKLESMLARFYNWRNAVFSGHDTTFASMSTMIHHISKNPEIEKALIEEIASFKLPLDFDELKNAPVLNAVMYESWRIDPPITTVFRKSTRNLEYKGYTFPEGTTFHTQLALAANDETVFRDAQNEFKIQRFLPEDHHLADPHWFINTQGAFSIFDGGGHVCLGKSFAQLELRVLLANMYAKYKVGVRNDRQIYFPIYGWSVDFKLTKK